MQPHFQTAMCDLSCLLVNLCKIQDAILYLSRKEARLVHLTFVLINHYLEIISFIEICSILNKPCHSSVVHYSACIGKAANCSRIIQQNIHPINMHILDLCVPQVPAVLSFSLVYTAEYTYVVS